MKTIYAACLSRLGLSLTGAAALHCVSLETVKHWSSGRRPVPHGIWDQLRAVEDRISDAAADMLEAWEAQGSPPVEINADDASGETLMAAAAFALASNGPMHVGETAATRLARQARRPN